MYCEKCGNQNQDDAKFCTSCGKPMNNGNYTVITPAAGGQRPPATQGSHVSTGGWFGRILLSNIPIVGIVMLFVWAFGNTQQTSLKTWARAQLIFMIIPIGIILTIVILTAITYSSLAGHSSTYYYYR